MPSPVFERKIWQCGSNRPHVVLRTYTYAGSVTATLAPAVTAEDGMVDEPKTRPEVVLRSCGVRRPIRFARGSTVLWLAWLSPATVVCRGHLACTRVSWSTHPSGSKVANTSPRQDVPTPTCKTPLSKSVSHACVVVFLTKTCSNWTGN